jgi:hypothetical protein
MGVGSGVFVLVGISVGEGVMMGVAVRLGVGVQAEAVMAAICSGEDPHETSKSAAINRTYRERDLGFMSASFGWKLLTSYQPTLTKLSQMEYKNTHVHR